MENIKGLNTRFATLELRNPIIAASCSLTGSAKSNQMLAEAGVGAIVLKSLFEEDIARENAALASSIEHTEGADYLHYYQSSQALSDYARLISDSKAVCGDVPIIASINCISSSEWVEYAKVVGSAGADALELNVMSIERNPMASDGEIEQRYITIAQSVAKATQLPIIMKLSSVLSNHASLVSRLMASGVSGIVMFNRDYKIDIDIDSMSYCCGEVLSSGSEFATALRYTSIISAAVPQASLAISGGVKDGASIIKSLLVGASAVEVCSTFYRNTGDIAKWVSEALATVADWQSKKGYDSVEEYCGAMNNSCDEHKDEVMRAHFLKHFGTYKHIK